jgi:hypothetical protein
VGNGLLSHVRQPYRNLDAFRALGHERENLRLWNANTTLKNKTNMESMK